MKRSRFKDTARSKDQTSGHPDSDGSGSVVSLHSSSSGEGKSQANPHPEGRTMIQVESVEEITSIKNRDNRFKDDSTPAHSKLDRLQKRLQAQPTQDTLDEIIHSMKNQNGVKDSQPNDSSTGATYPGSVGWNTMSPSQVNGKEKMGEIHARQLKDISAHFESEINKIHEQLCNVGNSLLALQDALPVKMLEAANHKLEARCNVLEQVCEQMKNKFGRLEHSNQELDKNCGQLRQVNQNLEVRCLYLEQVSQCSEGEKTELQKNVRDLEDKVTELGLSNEKAISACRQLEDLNQKNETKIQSMEEARKLLESKYKSCASENQKLENQIGQCQKTLDQYKRKFRDFEEASVTSKREKENLAMKLEFLNKSHLQIKEKYEELKSMCAPKDELIARLENEMMELSGFVEKTMKEKTEAEGKSKRDEELLQRMLVEYDILARDYQQAQESKKAIHGKLELSQTEMTNLRETISKLASRNTVLEAATKGNDNLQPKSSIDQLTGKNKTSKGRKTWDQSTPIKKREPQLQNMTTTYSRSEMVRDVLGGESTSSSQPYSTLDAHSCMSNIPSYERKRDSLSSGTQTHISAPTVPSLGRKPDLSSSGPRTSTPVKKQPVKSLATKDSPESSQSTLPGSMMVKKTNLLTMFDVVFEDANSGEEMFRSHTGRTCRMYSEPAQTEASFIPSSDEAANGLTDSSFGTSRNSRMLPADDYDGIEPRKTKSKQGSTCNVAEKDAGISDQAVGRDCTEQNTKMYFMEKRFSNLTEERKMLESTLSRMTKRSEEDKAYLESRLEEVAKELAYVRSQLRRH
ncbi:M-phase phosphoprotein 9-like isoform X2 [Montipora capricornis]|uniref:M-phase phosphoprotein 9-like isoform X1 n=1 Tax=Montipora capricornis TaxID=246305 RepID=UPI0035F16486